MSELQSSLLIIGAIIVGGVFAFNRWQESRARKSATENFSSAHDDVLLGRSPAQSPTEKQTLNLERTEPKLPAEQSFAPADVGQSLPAETVDYSIELTAESPASGSAILESWSPIEHYFSGKARMFGLVAGEWAPVRAGNSYETLRSSVQVINRSGVIGESDLLEFRSAMETLAAKNGYTTTAPEMREALDRARRLDAVCAEVDIQVAFHVISAGELGFSPDVCRKLARECGLVPGPSGTYTMFDSQKREIFLLAVRTGTTSDSKGHPLSLTVSMDLPRVPDVERSFESMVRFGRQAAAKLDGVLVDDNDLPLSEHSLEAISRQLTLVKGTLETQGIVPGSALALRLFS